MARLQGMGKSRFKAFNPLHFSRCSSVFLGKKFRRCCSARALADISGSGGGCSPSEDRMSFWPAAGALAGTDTCGGGGVASTIGAHSAERVIRGGGVLSVSIAFRRLHDMKPDTNCTYCDGDDDHDDDVPR